MRESELNILVPLFLALRVRAAALLRSSIEYRLDLLMALIEYRVHILQQPIRAVLIVYQAPRLPVLRHRGYFLFCFLGQIAAFCLVFFGETRD